MNFELVYESIADFYVNTKIYYEDNGSYETVEDVEWYNDYYVNNASYGSVHSTACESETRREDGRLTIAPIEPFELYEDYAKWASFESDLRLKTTAIYDYMKVVFDMRFKWNVDKSSILNYANYGEMPYMNTVYVTDKNETNFDFTEFYDGFNEDTYDAQNPSHNGKNIFMASSYTYGDAHLHIDGTYFFYLYFYNNSKNKWFVFLVWRDRISKIHTADITKAFDGEWITFEYTRANGHANLQIDNTSYDYPITYVHTGRNYWHAFLAEFMNYDNSIDKYRSLMYQQIGNARQYIVPKDPELFPPEVYISVAEIRNGYILTANVTSVTDYSILWSTGEMTPSIKVQGFSPNEYTVTATNHDGSASDTVTVPGDYGCGFYFYEIAYSWWDFEDGDANKWKFEFDFKATLDDKRHLLIAELFDALYFEIGASYCSFAYDIYEYDPVLNSWIHCSLLCDNNEKTLEFKCGDFSKTIDYSEWTDEELKLSRIFIQYSNEHKCSSNYQLDNLKAYKYMK